MKGKKKCLKMIIFISLFLIIIFALLFIFNNNNFNSVENNNITMENEKPKEILKGLYATLAKDDKLWRKD